MDTLDIFRSAKLLMKEHSSGALNEALRRAADLRVKGDTAGSDVWLSISNAILWLQTDRPSRDESIQ